MENKRESYRNEYPPSARPKLRIDKKSYEVLDISEEGVRFCYNEPIKDIKVGDKIKGEIMFKNNQSINLEGKVIALRGRDVVVKPNQSISREDIIVKEEIGILRDYPLRKSSLRAV